MLYLTALTLYMIRNPHADLNNLWRQILGGATEGPRSVQIRRQQGSIIRLETGFIWQT